MKECDEGEKQNGRDKGKKRETTNSKTNIEIKVKVK